MTGESFLTDLSARPLASAHGSFRPQALFLGNGNAALEVVVVISGGTPRNPDLRAAWEARKANRPAPVLLVALHGSAAWLCGPAGEDPPIHPNIDRGQAERLCREGLAQPDRHAALRFLAQALPSLETALPGLRNEGLLALHELERGAPKRHDWAEIGAKARKALGRQGLDLLTGLGFKTERLDNLTQLLRSGDRRTALAVLLEQSESPEAGTGRFNNLSPVSYALAVADKENLPWVVVVQGTRIRLYPTEQGVGVGRRGRTETYVECQPALLKDDHAGYLWLLFSAEALSVSGTLSQLLESSRRFAGDLAERLRDRIYTEVVPALAAGIAVARGRRAHTIEDLDLTYQVALTALFRLLFIAYAEDRDLLPYRYNEAYRRRSLKQKAQELAEAARKLTPVASGDAHWQEVAGLWRAVAVGNSEWGVPAYDGGLFTEDPAISAAGASLAKIALPNESFETALRALLVIETPEGQLGPVDFRALGVREFGTIYEGLLESELSVADVDLVLDTKGNYVPAKRVQPPVVKAGEIYLHNRSGARKSSGSYFTKSFAVEHLLNGALEPALHDHLKRLDALDETDAAEAFFDFRIADIAMGSGHFLVAAVDHIERALAQYLSRRPLPGVQRELAALRTAATTALGELADQAVIEDGQLLRRLIARRCIYGLDFNELAVQLARLSIWIHTFVPGLPLSLLDHNLVRGNALVGVGTIADIRTKFEEAGSTLFPVDADNLLGQAAQPLQRLARLADATLKDIAKGRDAMEDARIAVGDTQALCDIITALPIAANIQFQFERWNEVRLAIQRSPTLRRARAALDGLRPLHFPATFPEVFLRRRPGFDVIVGNPPWEKLHVEEHEFWARHSSGFKGLGTREQQQQKIRLRRSRPDLVAQFQQEVEQNARVRQILTSSQQYPGIGTGHPDLYKAFCWRFWNLVAADGGRIGVVLPRSALAAKGSTDFRLAVFGGSSLVSITMLLNRGGWVFDEAEHRYTIGLVAVTRGAPTGDSIRLRGPYASRDALDTNAGKPPAVFSMDQVLTWTDTASLPLLPTEASIEVFAQLRKAPRFDLNDGKSWRARPEQEMNATTNQELMDVTSTECPSGFWPVYKGESFDIWNPDTGEYNAFADPRIVLPWLQAKRLRSAHRRNDSVHSEFSPNHLRDPATLACNKARIAFRDVARATDRRTAIAALVPPKLFLVHNAPCLHWSRGTEGDQAYLLGILCSIPLDWYARRFVETHLQFFVLNPFPIPRPTPGDVLRKRVIDLVGRLACPDARFAAWAKAVGVKHGKIGQDEKDDMIQELDAVVSHLYGLSEAQLVHIFETFHEGWDYGLRLDAVRRHYRAWAAKGT